jgi:hypothetical protein
MAMEIHVVGSHGEEDVLDARSLGNFSAGSGTQLSDIWFFLDMIKILDAHQIPRRGMVLSFCLHTGAFSSERVPLLRTHGLILRLGSLVENEVSVSWEEVLNSGSAWAAAQMIREKFLGLAGAALVDLTDECASLKNPVTIYCGEQRLQAKRQFYVLIPHDFPPDFFLAFLTSLMNSDLRKPNGFMHATFELRQADGHECVYFRTEYCFRRLERRHGGSDLFTPQGFPRVPWPDSFQLTAEDDPDRHATDILRALQMMV